MPTPPTEPPPFEVCGRVVYTTDAQNETFQETRRFVVSRKDTRWSIRTAPTRGERQVSSCTLFDEAAHDGTNLFHLTLHDTSGIELPEGTPYKREDIVPARATVKEDDCPVGLDIDLIYPLWLAYCASAHLSVPGEGPLVAPLFVTGGPDSQRFDLPARWELNPSGFARRVKWSSEGRSADWQPDGTVRLEEYPPPFDKGFLQATFEVTEGTGFQGIELPGRFVLKVFGPHSSDGSGKPDELELCYAIDGTAGTIRAPAGLECPPKLTTKTSITDYRCRPHGTPISYLSESAWMSVEEIKAKLRRIELGLEPVPGACCRKPPGPNGGKRCQD